MKKKFIGLLSLALTLCMGVSWLSFGLPENDGWHGFTDLSRLHVRVNGYEVEFTDAQPYIDENNRTMIPLRACVEALGAEVTWNQDTRTASITKNGTTVKVTIDSKELVVVNDGLVIYETMDTMAVLNAEEGRTYVPIRYVAEALGAYVDYSAAFRTIGIYQDVLSPKEIETLHQYELTYGSEPYTYEERIEKKGQANADEHFPYRKEQLESFANARECLYDSLKETTAFTYRAEFLDQYITEEDKEDFFALLVKEAVAELTYTPEHEEMYQRMRMEFRSDTSSIYAIQDGGYFYFNLRGYLLFYKNFKDTWDNADKYGLDYDGIHKADKELGTEYWHRLMKVIKRGKDDLEGLDMEDRYFAFAVDGSSIENFTQIAPVDVTIRIDHDAVPELQVYVHSITLLDEAVVVEGNCGWENYLPDTN